MCSSRRSRISSTRKRYRETVNAETADTFAIDNADVRCALGSTQHEAEFRSLDRRRSAPISRAGCPLPASGGAHKELAMLADLKMRPPASLRSTRPLMVCRHRRSCGLSQDGESRARRGLARGSARGHAADRLAQARCRWLASEEAAEAPRPQWGCRSDDAGMEFSPPPRGLR